MLRRKALTRLCAFVSLVASAALVVSAGVAAAPTVLQGAALTHVVPTGFYFEGQSAPTQMRNTAAVQWGAGKDARLVIVG
nr:hypothetical protein [Acidobacteriota bacterium]